MVRSEADSVFDRLPFCGDEPKGEEARSRAPPDVALAPLVPPRPHRVHSSSGRARPPLRRKANNGSGRCAGGAGSSISRADGCGRPERPLGSVVVVVDARLARQAAVSPLRPARPPHHLLSEEEFHRERLPLAGGDLEALLCCLVLDFLHERKLAEAVFVE
jgi:hypothetical protein